MTALKNYIIEIEGIDKSGKNSLIPYLNLLSNHKYIVHDRGILSMMVYSEKYNRDYEYKLNYAPIIIYLDVDIEDWNIRCNVCNEPYIDYHEDKKLFNKYKKRLIKNGITVFEYNTSKMTPYQIAIDVLEKISNIN